MGLVKTRRLVAMLKRKCAKAGIRFAGTLLWGLESHVDFLVAREVGA